MQHVQSVQAFPLKNHLTCSCTWNPNAVTTHECRSPSPHRLKFFSLELYMHGVKRQSYLATDGRIKELKQKDLKRRVHVHVSQASVQGQQAAARAKIQLSTTGILGHNTCALSITSGYYSSHEFLGNTFSSKDIFKRFQDGIHWSWGCSIAHLLEYDFDLLNRTTGRGKTKMVQLYT